MNYHWILPPHIENIKEILKYPYNETLLSILYQRGFKNCDSVGSYLDKSLKSLHDPHQMFGMDSAVKRIIAAIDNKENILIFGDYDVDGITAITILMKFFKFINYKASFHVPHRINEGYGLNADTIIKAHEDKINLIITVDTGITNVEEVNIANKHNIDVIITDHHKPPIDLPKAFAILNPNLPDCSYPNKNLAGVGVAFKLVHACLKKLMVEEKTAKQFLKQLLDFVTLGTIADLASLIGENRDIVAYGLKQLSLSSFPGIRILLDKLGVSEKPLTAGMVAFKVTPKLNASGRMDHGNFSAKLLLEDDPEECRTLFSKLEKLNIKRQNIEEKNLKQAIAIADQEKNPDERFLIIKHDDFHPGVNGIIASRLVEKYHLPAIVCAPDGNGNLKGSARSIKGLNIFDCLNNCKDLCQSFGGHAYAAGLSIHEDNFLEFKARLHKIVKENFTEKDFEPKLSIDAVIDLHDITDDFMNDFKLMEPFGFGNSEPCFLTKNAKIIDNPKILKGKHLKFSVSQNGSAFEVIGFNFCDKLKSDLKTKDKIDLVYKIGLNHWLGLEKIQLKLVDLRKN